jgi:gamma-glutamyl phosphate reductase
MHLIKPIYSSWEKEMDIKAYVLNKAKDAKEGARALMKVSSKDKNLALLKMAEALRKNKILK